MVDLLWGFGKGNFRRLKKGTEPLHKHTRICILNYTSHIYIYIKVATGSVRFEAGRIQDLKALAHPGLETLPAVSSCLGQRLQQRCARATVQLGAANGEDVWSGWEVFTYTFFVIGNCDDLKFLLLKMGYSALVMSEQQCVAEDLKELN